MEIQRFSQDRQDEVVELIQVAQSEWGSGEEKRSIRARIAGPGRSAWIAEENGRVLGFTSWTPELNSYAPSPQAGPGSAHLSALYVLQAAQGRGLGARLHSRILAEAKERGMQEIRLWTPHPAKSRGFYEHLGYQDSGRRITYDEITRVEYRRVI